jgi:hypothetical protein
VAWERDHISQGISRNPSTRGFFGFHSSLQNCIWNHFSLSGLSQICKIRNEWNLPSPFSIERSAWPFVDGPCFDQISE